MTGGASVDILLATYNGERFLPEQLASLLAQKDQDFRIIARDDGSRDGTVRLLEEFAIAHPGRLLLLPSDGAARGACGNFAELMQHSDAPYVMFCDQDDHWHADKVAASRQEMMRLEALHGRDRPLLVFSDLCVVAEDSSEIAPSFAVFQRLPLNGAFSLRRNLLQNSVAGCTMMANRALVELSAPIPAVALLHDHWLALVASAFGSMHAIQRPLIDYRQHAGNAVGAISMSGHGLVRRFHRLQVTGFADRLARHVAQAEAFLGLHGSRLSIAQRRVCEAFVRLPQRSWLGRRWVVVRHGLWMSGAMRNLGLLATL